MSPLTIKSGIGTARLALSYLSKKALEYRSEKFLDVFYDEMKREINEREQNGDADVTLKNILESEKVKECVFESFRSVFISKSRTLSPVCLAFLSAKIVAQGRSPELAETMAFEAIELMSDGELKEFHKTFKDTITSPNLSNNSAGTPRNEAGQIVIYDCIENASGESIDISQFNLDVLYGSWARKLQTVGLMSSKTVVGFEEIHVDSNEESSGGIANKIRTSAMISPDAMTLYQAVDRALHHLEFSTSEASNVQS